MPAASNLETGIVRYSTRSAVTVTVYTAWWSVIGILLLHKEGRFSEKAEFSCIYSYRHDCNLCSVSVLRAGAGPGQSYDSNSSVRGGRITDAAIDAPALLCTHS